MLPDLVRGRRFRLPPPTFLAFRLMARTRIRQQPAWGDPRTCLAISAAFAGAALPAFPGYLICVTSQVDELADKLRRVRSLTKILGNDNAFIPLTEDERAWVQKVTQKDQRTVGESVGYMEDGKLVIVEGPLKGREDWVRKVNHRKRLAYLEMPMGGRTVRAQAGLQMVSKAQGKLLDREK